MKTTQGKTFKHPPLKQVAFEINFDIVLKIEQQIALYQDMIRTRLPIYDPEVEVSTVPEVFKPDLGKKYFVFRNKEKTKTLRASSSNFNYIVDDYSNFASYINDVISYSTDFCKTYEITTFNRMGLRYINNLDIPMRNGVYDFTHYVK